MRRKLKRKSQSKIESRTVPNSKNSIVVMGLGNPGAKFERTRHNVGYHVVNLVLDERRGKLRRGFFRRYSYCELTNGPGHQSLVLVRSNSYMNRVGDIVPELLRRYRAAPERFMVVVDNVDLMPGMCRIKRGGGDAGHNGLKSVVRALGHGDFYRLYIGVGRPPGTSLVDHVLGVPDKDDLADIDRACVRASRGVIELAYRPISRMMEEINHREA